MYFTCLFLLLCFALLRTVRGVRHELVLLAQTGQHLPYLLQASLKRGSVIRCRNITRTLMSTAMLRFGKDRFPMQRATLLGWCWVTVFRRVTILSLYDVSANVFKSIATALWPLRNKGFRRQRLERTLAQTNTRARKHQDCIATTLWPVRNKCFRSEWLERRMAQTHTGARKRQDCITTTRWPVRNKGFRSKRLERKMAQTHT